jgi:hypothetical protein
MTSLGYTQISHGIDTNEHINNRNHDDFGFHRICPCVLNYLILPNES